MNKNGRVPRSLITAERERVIILTISVFSSTTIIMCVISPVVYICGHSHYTLRTRCHVARNDFEHRCVEYDHNKLNYIFPWFPSYYTGAYRTPVRTMKNEWIRSMEECPQCLAKRASEQSRTEEGDAMMLDTDDF